MLKNLLPLAFHQLRPKTLTNFVKLYIIPYGILKRVKNKRLEKRYTSKFLKENDVSDLTQREKWTLLAYLQKLESEQQQLTYLEVGIYAGGTIKFLKRHTKVTTFTGIDLFEDFKPSGDNTHEWRNYSKDIVQEALGQDVTLYKGDSVEVLKSLQEKNKFDFIFIDGNHTYEATKQDFEAGLPMLKKGGFVAFHNCSPGFSQEDQAYLTADGGPWLLTEEIKEQNKLKFIYEADRLRIFRYLK